MCQFDDYEANLCTNLLLFCFGINKYSKYYSVFVALILVCMGVTVVWVRYLYLLLNSCTCMICVIEWSPFGLVCMILNPCMMLIAVMRLNNLVISLCWFLPTERHSELSIVLLCCCQTCHY